MALRTVITPQNLTDMEGQDIAFQSIDQTNGMQIKNTDSQVVLIRTGAGAGVTVTFPSVPDAFGRVGDITDVVPENSLRSYGPFSPAVNWGDGAAQLFLDFTGSAGAPEIAAITII